MRLVGFKSFVEATDFEINEGLTGVVGPNGCGKSNILEALRWVMGATSAKALRGDGMSDVIFAGTSMRPARNWAEVTLTLDNSDRTAPAEYNEETILEVSRRIIRKDDGAQSIYRINAREVRAKDVQLLFADASTGANSPALVRQGQVAELINAKPQNRRRLLEEAAGITGLHTRRHEAELRLRAAEANLERLEDVTGELENQKAALARQARQAVRYRNVSGDIRRAEAMVAHLRWAEAKAADEQAQRALEEIAVHIEETARAASRASTAQAAAHEALDPLRAREAEAAAALHRLTVARESLDEEQARAETEIARLTADIERLGADIAREADLARDADEAIETLAREEQGLKAREGSEAERIESAARAMRESADRLAEAERRFDEKNAEAAEIDAGRRAAEAGVAEAERRTRKISAQIETLRTERSDVALSEVEARALEEASARFAAAEEAARAGEAAFQRAEEDRAAAEAGEREARGPHQKAAQSLAELTAECDALKRVLAANSAGDWPALIEAVSVAPGYENALAAALGDDLGAALDAGAPVHWSDAAARAAHPQLPPEAAPLSRFVKAPPAVKVRLDAIGVVASETGARLQTSLAPGVRLVSREGDLWRWDGFVARAEAKTAAAIRLEQRNRLNALEGDLDAASARADKARGVLEAAQKEVARRQTIEREARALFADARRAVDAARAALTKLERDHERASTRIASIDEALRRVCEDEADARAALEAARSALEALPDQGLTAAALAEAREALGSARSAAGEARAAHNDLAREAQMRAERLDELARERGVWSTRGATAREREGELKARLDAAETARDDAAKAPDAITAKRRKLLDAIGEAEAARDAAADALASASAEVTQADKTAKEADAAAAQAREARARAEAQAEGAQTRLAEAVGLAHETCSAAPEELLTIAEHRQGQELPAREEVERKLERYRRERENLGGVNLRADEELEEIAGRLAEITTEREDCEAAIRKLRAAIGGLNKEARGRLVAAFETVNRNFASLFTRLFNGGQAELQMVDSEDVLEAGLEIFASPPGKKLASMSLMSGGEQALTATALIFAVFMANPAPVCVLDEVDAPLDDANTERFCRMLHEMARETETRFIVITHHALTMSRVDRLFGVTMIERGVSQLVSVDLKKATQLAAE